MNAGFLPVAATDSDEALDMVQSIKIDMLLAEIGTGGQLDGVELAELIRMTRPRTAVIYMTDFAQAHRLTPSLRAPVIQRSSLGEELRQQLTRVLLGS